MYITLYNKWESDSQYLEAQIESSGGPTSGSRQGLAVAKITTTGSDICLAVS